MIRRLSLPLVVLIVLVVSLAQSRAASYPLLNGEVLMGEPIAPDANGLIVRQANGNLSPRVAWTNFTEAALKELVKLPSAKPFVEQFLDVEEEPSTEQQAAEIKPKPVTRLPRLEPEAGLMAMFSSPISLTLFLLLYLANIYAGHEVSIFRNYPTLLVCGISLVLPVIGPVLFLCLPTRLQHVPGETYEIPPEELVAGEVYSEEVAPAAGAAAPPALPAVPTLPPPVIYVRGQTTFNRRFFETKLAGYMRPVPGEAEKDMVLHVRSSRGEHQGNRIIRVTPNEFYLQINKAGATADIMLPYNEIAEIQVRHKDA